MCNNNCYKLEHVLYHVENSVYRVHSLHIAYWQLSRDWSVLAKH